MNAYYADEQVTIYHGDGRDLARRGGPPGTGCLILDPPWDQPALLDGIPLAVSSLVFTDPRRLGEAVERYGGPAWVFTWDTMSPWSTGPTRPLQQTKQALWYGDLDTYQRDGALWGDPPEEKDHPSTTFTPIDGRRLVDLHRDSLRWLHHPGAGSGSVGTARFGKRQADPVWRHAKPEPWIRCLIANTSPGGVVFDPFMGTGTALLAAKNLGRMAVGFDTNERACEVAAERLAQGVLALGPE